MCKGNSGSFRWDEKMTGENQRRHRYRVRRGLFGKSVLQRLENYPSFVGGVVDASVRDVVWEDVPYKRAPRALTTSLED
jgi:hypothetical protein